MVQKRADLYAVSKLLGHANITMTERIYAELLNTKNLETVNVIDTLSGTDN